jgi:hypothetical protein
LTEIAGQVTSAPETPRFTRLAGRGEFAVINVVDPGFMVDPVDWDTPNQPHYPDQPRNTAHQPGKKDK